MRVGQTSFVVFTSKFVGSALGFLATLYFARELGAEVLGYYFSALAVVAWLAIAGDVGVGDAMKKRISEGEEPRAYFTAGVLLVGGFAVLIAGAVLLASTLVDAYIGREVSALVALILIFELYYLTTEAALEGERRVHLAGLLSTVKIGARSLGQIGLVLLGWGLFGLLVGYAAGGLVVGTIILVVLEVGFEVPRRRHVESLLSFAKFSWLGKLQSRTFNDADIIVLTALVPSALVGVYSVAWSITRFLTIFGSAISSTMFPELSAADAEDRNDVISTLVTDAVTYSGLLLVPGLIGAALVGDFLLGIYGTEFVQGRVVLVVLVGAALLYGYQEQFMYALNGLDRPDLAFRVNAAFIGSNLVMNVLFVVAFGYVGAAVATAISAVIGLVLSFTALRSLVSFEVPIGEIARQVAAAVLMGLVVFGGRATVVSRVSFSDGIPVLTANSVAVAILVPTGAAVYFLTLLGISSEFRSTVVKNLPEYPG